MTSLGVIYDQKFYDNQIDGSRLSASIIIPKLLNVLGRVESVVDVGCGAGTWLSQFQRLGIQNVFGVDGGSPLDSQLLVSADLIKRQDLEKPITLERRFDLAMSLEVAEHLSSDRAKSFVEDLCRLSDVVLFGAAIPGQGGENHINECWQTFWADLFAINGYDCFDVVRSANWHEPQVEWWYSQNTLLYVKRGTDLHRKIAEAAGMAVPILDVVHPKCFFKQLGVDVSKTNGIIQATSREKILKKRIKKYKRRYQRLAGALLAVLVILVVTSIV